MTDWHIAQMNVGRVRFPIEHPRMRGFTGRLDEINALAERSPGFVWRLQSDSGNATDIQVTDDPFFIVNMSVWESVEALFDFAYRSAHQGIMARRRRWFEVPDGPYQVLWWIEAGRRPTVEDGLVRLERLGSEGPGPFAFTFKAKFPPPGNPGEPQDLKPEPFCVGWS